MTIKLMSELQNNGPEGHYISNLWYEQNHDAQPYAYANQLDWSHKGWQPLISSFITAWKAGVSSQTGLKPTSGSAQDAIWYHTIKRKSIVCPSTGMGQGYYDKPDGFDGFDGGDNGINWAIIIDPAIDTTGYKVQLFSGNNLVYTEPAHGGMNFGSAPANPDTDDLFKGA